MKTSEIKELTTAEIQERLISEREQLTRMKLNHSISPLENPLQIREARKTIARLMTELRQSEINNN